MDTFIIRFLTLILFLLPLQPSFLTARHLRSPKKIEPKYQLAICSIFQNEAGYLKEWIEFHRLLGVEHFYLFNNLSTDNFHSVLAPYVKNKVITLIEWPYPDFRQCAAYDAAIKIIRMRQNGWHFWIRTSFCSV